MKIDPRDKPILLALIALAFGLGLNAIISLAYYPNPKAANGKNEDPYEVPKLFLEALEAGGTAIIAGFAIWAFWDTRKGTERQLRAYVDIKRTTYDKNPDDPNGRWDIDTVLKNFGQTPARNVIIKIEGAVGEKRNEGEIFAFTTNAVIYPAAGIPPGGQMIVSGPPGIANGQAGFLAASKAGLRSYVWGEISYLDVFDREHSLRFQMVCKFGDIVTFNYCAAGNADRSYNG